MKFSKLAILDVGHGNCAVLVDQNGVAVIDTGLGPTLAQMLHQNQLENVNYVFISHADKDHIAGLVGLLALGTVRVEKIYLNPDAPRSGKLWEDLISVLKAAKRSGTHVVHGLSTEIPGILDLGRVQIQIVAPTLDLALRGTGGRTSQGKAISAHTINAVIRLVHNAHPLALLPGDLDEVGLQHLVDERVDISADVIVFPHHGGISGKEPEQFAKKLCELVRPELVVFSIGRGKYNTPRPEIVHAVRGSLPTAHIACTQLSNRCAIDLPKISQTHLTAEVAQGREHKKCCAGTILITIGESIQRTPSDKEHSAFINTSALTAVCRN